MSNINPLPQALLLQAPEHIDTLEYAFKLAKYELCEHKTTSHEACGHCKPCKLITQNIHPDVVVITPEKLDASIKVDQIRALHTSVYQTPQCGRSHIVIIHLAHRLNRAAANALLKVLEEPPKHLHFILTAATLSTVPATIISRCQQRHVGPNSDMSADFSALGYLSLGEHYPKETTRHQLYLEHEQILNTLSAIADNKASVCQAASKWSKHSLSDMLWLMQLITLSIIKLQCLPQPPHISQPHPFGILLDCHDTKHYFKLLDKIFRFRKALYQNIPLNPTLALETLLIGYVC